MTRIREIGLMILTAAIILFAAWNLEPVDVDFLAWNFQVPLALVTLVPMLAGLLIGVGATAVRMRKRRRPAEAESQAESEASPELPPAPEAERAVADEEEETTAQS